MPMFKHRNHYILTWFMFSYRVCVWWSGLLKRTWIKTKINDNANKKSKKDIIENRKSVLYWNICQDSNVFSRRILRDVWIFSGKDLKHLFVLSLKYILTNDLPCLWKSRCIDTYTADNLLRVHPFFFLQNKYQFTQHFRDLKFILRIGILFSIFNLSSFPVSMQLL